MQIIGYYPDGLHTQLSRALFTEDKSSALPQSNGNLPPMRLCLHGTTVLHALNFSNVRRTKMAPQVW